MKKNRMMRLASILLVCVLLSTSVISGTFAKYVTEGAAEDSARVAKWGVTFDIQGGPLFSKQYATTDKANFASMTYSVNSSDTQNVVAPGTAGELVTFRTLGTPEVSYEVVMSVDEAATETIFTNKKIIYSAEDKAYSAEDITDGYYPVKLTLNYNGSKVGEYTAIADLNAAIAKCGYYFDVTDSKYYVTTDGKETYAAAQNTAPTLTINWVWGFDVDDVADTTLGNLAAIEGLAGAVSMAKTDYNLDLAVNIKAVATQID